MRSILFGFIAIIGSILFSISIFLAIDKLYTNYRINEKLKLGNCKSLDQYRHHTLLPNCAGRKFWGNHTYEIFTNDLGMRDFKIRNIETNTQNPRILFLGDSFTEGIGEKWENTFVGKFANAFPYYSILNGGVETYSPSNYFLTAKIVLEKNIKIDEVIVFIDMSDIQDELIYIDIGPNQVGYRDKYDILYKENLYRYENMDLNLRQKIRINLILTNFILEYIEKIRGKFQSRASLNNEKNNIINFDSRGEWTYNKSDKVINDYKPLGIDGSIKKAKYKMDLLYKLLKKYNIPISVAVYPWPAQLNDEDRDSLQIKIWKKWCDGKCKRFINLFPDFFAEKDKCPKYLPGCWYEKLYIFGDVHLKEYGNQIIADRLVKEFNKIPIMHTKESK